MWVFSLRQSPYALHAQIFFTAIESFVIVRQQSVSQPSFIRKKGPPVSGAAPFKVLPTEHKTDGIFEELKDIQRRFDYLPVEEIKKVAQRRGMALKDVHAVASFYPHFYLAKPAKCMVKVCDDMTCHLRGAPALQRQLEQRFQGMSPNELTIRNVSCLADESEPGSIHDRFLLTQFPHLVLEGMALAGLCIGAKRGYLYIRHEYQEQEHILRSELVRCYQQGLLGKKILGSDISFDLTIFVSPGGYICGEESALIEAIEGKRAEPRNKPPFVATHGLWMKPTVLNNVETFAFATAIAAKGAAWFNALGKPGFPGPKFVGVSGDVRQPGIFEVPMGTTYKELIETYAGGIPGGRKLIGFAPSGPSSGYLPASMAELPVDWNTVAKAGSMVGSGAVVVCAEGTCMLDMALNAVRFFRNESCGKCVPCRIGTHKLTDMLQNWCHGKYGDQEMTMVGELCHALKQTSICGLGQIVPAPIESVLKHFAQDVEEHIVNGRCPAGVCKMERN